ncbi:hypothetical protein MTR_1g087740 [Medicago truncatula]|uniref:Uncharacterized protein n=1 Tax=Medicago truncatula TaxID=3880 RepID=G7IEH7_MEDTR|nr:hypothetical protein MTR_1g087740 [Medicago truncatula]
MDTKIGNAEISGNNDDDYVERSSNIKHLENFHFGKALAFRAVYGSSGFQRSGSRKTRGNDSKTLSPSRLSKVTYKVVVDDTDA